MKVSGQVVNSFNGFDQYNQVEIFRWDDKDFFLKWELSSFIRNQEGKISSPIPFGTPVLIFSPPYIFWGYVQPAKDGWIQVSQPSVVFQFTGLKPDQKWTSFINSEGKTQYYWRTLHLPKQESDPVFNHEKGEFSWTQSWPSSVLLNWKNVDGLFVLNKPFEEGKDPFFLERGKKYFFFLKDELGVVGRVKNLSDSLTSISEVRRVGDPGPFESAFKGIFEDSEEGEDQIIDLSQVIYIFPLES